jgi:hypothetical protein
MACKVGCSRLGGGAAMTCEGGCSHRGGGAASDEKRDGWMPVRVRSSASWFCRSTSMALIGCKLAGADRGELAGAIS